MWLIVHPHRWTIDHTQSRRAQRPVISRPKPTDDAQIVRCPGGTTEVRRPQGYRLLPLNNLGRTVVMEVLCHEQINDLQTVLRQPDWTGRRPHPDGSRDGLGLRQRHLRDERVGSDGDQSQPSGLDSAQPHRIRRTGHHRWSDRAVRRLDRRRAQYVKLARQGMVHRVARSGPARLSLHCDADLRHRWPGRRPSDTVTRPPRTRTGPDPKPAVGQYRSKKLNPDRRKASPRLKARMSLTYGLHTAPR